MSIPLYCYRTVLVIVLCCSVTAVLINIETFTDVISKTATNKFAWLSNLYEDSSAETATSERQTYRRWFSAWYGAIAYPSAPSREESWKWLLNFFESIPKQANETDVIQLLRNITRKTEQKRKRTSSLALVSFPNTTASSFEQQLTTFYERNSMNVSWYDMPRHECFTGLCEGHTKEDQEILRQQPLEIVENDVVLLNFRHADMYDVENIVKNLRDVSALITVFSTESSPQIYDNDYPLLFFDFFHKMYFAYDWIPRVVDFARCQNSRYECQMWIVWEDWHQTEDRAYIPPAGNGSLFTEIDRFRKVLVHATPQACKLKQGFGGHYKYFGYVDGIYWVCLDTFVKGPEESSCLVYSFGVNFDWSFDDAMQRLGCEVYSFDIVLGNETYQRNPNHWFVPWGVGDTRTAGNITIKTLAEIRAAFNHTDRRISVLKLDIEGSEWEVLKTSFTDGSLDKVSQIMIETHPTDALQEQRWLHQLEKLGFVLFSSRKNPGYPDARSYPVDAGNMLLYELAYINKNLDP